MQFPVYNPYSYIRANYNAGLDYIIANVPTTNCTYADIVDSVIGYAGTLPWPPDEENIRLIKSITNNSANDYINERIYGNLNFGAQEMAFIDSVLDGLKENGIESLNEFLNACVQELTASSINTITKAPIYAALALAQESYAYWVAVVGTPGDWANYINANAAINYANIPGWAATAFISTFSGYSQIIAVEQTKATTRETEFRVVALEACWVAAIAVVAGDVVVKWARMPQNEAINY